MAKRVFVTVGTTQFNDLIVEVTKKDVLEALYLKGYRYLSLQVGDGCHVPQEGQFYGITIDEVYKYKESLRDDFNNADLIISHAGAGSCMEALMSKKLLIAVVNDSLMNNHQKELAEALAEEGFSEWCHPSSLSTTINKFDNNKIKEYVPTDTKKIIECVDAMFFLWEKREK